MKCARAWGAVTLDTSLSRQVLTGCTREVVSCVVIGCLISWPPSQHSCSSSPVLERPCQRAKLTLLVPYVCACCGLQDDVGTPQPISPTSVSCPGLTPRICSVWPGWGEGSLNIPFPLFEYAAFSPTYRLRPKPS